MIRLRRFIFLLLGFLLLLPVADLWFAPPRADGATLQVSGASAKRRQKGARQHRQSPARRRETVAPSRRNYAPRRPVSLSGAGIEPRRNLLLADPVMGQLRTAGQAFLESPTPLHRRELESFAARHANHQAGALAHLALGYNAILAQEFSDAAAFLRAGRKIASPVPDYFDYYLAHSLQKLKQHREAVEALNGFEQRYPDSSLMGRAVLARAEGLIETGRATVAAELLKTRLDALKRPEADLWLGRAHAVRSDLAAALEAYRQAYYLYPASEEAEEAGREIARLERQMPRGVPPPPPGLRKERAERLFEARQFRAAEEAYRQLAAAVTGAERERALVRSAAAAYRAGKTSAAYTALSGLQPADGAADAERLYYLGECYRRLSRESAFLETVRRLGERYPDSPWREEALFSAGNYFLLKRDSDQSETYYRALYQQFPSGKYADPAHWRVAWMNYRAGNFDSARGLFEEHVVRYPQSAQVAAALYWLGRLAEECDPAAALAYFRKASNHFPQYFYGILAREKLSEKLRNTKPTESSATTKLAERPAATMPPGDGRLVSAAVLPDHITAVLAAVPTYHPSLAGTAPPADLAAHRRKVEALEAAWLLDLAALELRHSTTDPTHSQYLLAELARLEHDRGRFLAAIVYLRQVFPNYFAYPFEELDRRYWELLFPLPWWPVVQAESRRHGLDPYLVAGLMRQESAFDPWAVSRARAYGLMQLLPSTARRLARKLGMPPPGVATLFDPQTNIELGTRYFYDTLQRYGGRLEAALASYNAGPGRADAWLAQNTYRDVAEFVESIPFTETREYVQAVIRNAAVYRRLYAGR